MNISQSLFYGLVFTSVFCALLLAVAVIPLQYVWLRPEFVCLVLLYWTLYTPQHIGVGLAWLAGLLEDLAVGGVWGAHALALAVVALVAQIAYQRLCSYSIWQQCFWIFMLVGVHQLFANWLESLHGVGGPIGLVMLPTVISALCWPLLVMVLHQLRRHYHLQ